MNTLTEPPSHASQQDDIFGDGPESPDGCAGQHDNRRDSLMTEPLNSQPRISQQSSNQRRGNYAPKASKDTQLTLLCLQ
jgi:hypothetical protein